MQQLVYTPEELERIQMGLLALLCYAALSIEKELQAAQRREAMRARRARKLQVVKGGKPMRAA